MMDYNIYDREYAEKENVLDIIYGAYSDNTDKEIETIYQKAEAFDEIVNEFHYQLQNLESWNTLDQKDCQTLKQIIEENIEEEQE